VRPDVVVDEVEREFGVELDTEHRTVALAPEDVDVATLDAEEERGAEGDGRAAGGGELVHEGHDGGALVELEGEVQGSVAALEFGEQGWGVVAGLELVAGQELGGAGIGVVLGSAVQRKVKVNVGHIQDVSHLGVQLGQSEHALQHLHRRIVTSRTSKRSGTKGLAALA